MLRTPPTLSPQLVPSEREVHQQHQSAPTRSALDGMPALAPVVCAAAGRTLRRGAGGADGVIRQWAGW